MNAILILVDQLIHLIQIYIWIIIASAIFSWLIALNLANRENHFVSLVGYWLYRLTDPPLRPIRSVLPNMGGIDISPVILILALILLREFLWRL